MGWDGAGNVNRTINWTTRSGKTVSTANHEAHDADLAGAIQNSIAKDGQNSPTADLPMAGQKHTNVDDAALRNQYAAAGQIQDQSLTHITATNTAGTANAITIEPTPPITAYAAGQRFSFVAEGTNTGAVTVDVSSLGAKAVQKLGAALVAGDIATGDLVAIEYDGTQFQLLTPARTPVLTSGGIPTAALADDAVTLAKMASGTDGNLITYDADGNPAHVATGTAGQVLRSNGPGAAPTFQEGGLPRSYLAGFKLSNNGTDADHDIDIAVGECRNDAASGDIALSSALTKRIDASWSVGTNQGGLDGTESVAGTPDANTWYHVWAIRRSDTGVVDVLFSESASSPTMPTDYDTKRRIGAVRTDGSANIIPFIQTGDKFLWVTVRNDYAQNNPGASAVLVTLSVPTGLKVTAIAAWAYEDLDIAVANVNYMLVTDPDQTDSAPSASLFTLAYAELEASRDCVGTAYGEWTTNTSAQLRFHAEVSDGGITVRETTYGWIDRRGRDD